MLELIELSKAASADLEIPGFQKPPFPFQNAGILYATERKHVIIGDEMGLGKTIQGLGTVALNDAFPALIITPASNKYQWLAEWKACMPEGERDFVHVANKDTTEFTLLMCKAVITNYEQLHDGFTDKTKKDVKLSQLGQNLLNVNFKSIILDEAHYIKSAEAARTKAVMELRKIGSLVYRMVLTGTPMLNKPDEFYTLLKFLDRLDEFGGFWKFINEWCGMKQGKYRMKTKKGHDFMPLNEKLRSTCYIRRKKKDVLTELPDKLRTSYFIDITNRKEYKNAEDDLINWVRNRVERDQEFMASIAHLSDAERQFAIEERKDFKAAAAERGEVMVRLTALKRLAAEGKLKAAKEWIDNFRLSGEKLVIFACHKFFLDELLKWYPTSCRLLSVMDAAERQAEVKRFQETDEQLFIGAQGTSAANSPAGIGHTLTAASNTLHLELGWTPGHMNQCEDRCHRIGQKSSCTAHYILGRETIEEDLANIIESKRTLSAQVVDGDEAVTESRILDELVEKLMEKVK